MGRKIPAKKHRGVKDPLVQQARRQERIKNKINAPPRDPDEQPVPKSLTRLFAPMTRAPRAAGPRAASRSAARRSAARPGTDASTGVSRLKRLPGEGARSFSRRITCAVRALHAADDAQDYPQEDEEEEVRERRRRRPADPERTTRKERRKQRLREAKTAADQERALDARGEAVYERVPFGAVAEAPPALPAPRLPRHVRDARAAATHAPRPGRRELLLTPLLKGPNKAGSGARAGAGAGAGADAAEQRRLAVVAAYRAHKAAQNKAARR